MVRPHMIERDKIQFNNPSFPLMATTTEGVSPGFQRLHWHVAMEMNYIRQGSGYYLINGIKVPFRQGDLIMINGNDVHRAFEQEQLVMDVILFEPSLLAVDLKYDPDILRPFREIGVSFSPLVAGEQRVSTDLIHLFRAIMDEINHERPSALTLARAYLLQFLALANRHLALSEVPLAPVKHRGMNAIKEVIHTMEMNMAYPWTLGELADLVHLSPSRFSALFQQTVGTSPMDYLIQLRLTQAVHLLESTELKVIDIAERCGFRNLSNFNRLFKQHIGTSPSDVRQHYEGVSNLVETVR
ncbi:AraC family transcriptional regulator [Paenibacillus agilis]|uniref:Helix-turn-helix domain-containing protein n=1 Tax=Paenibacillus agilis TaxID=3020863 RepID=A0A559IY00_9BACL|nr:AraC family transcriptional regulator [Paenibacillus agilis]TVX92493.1 helix-turn-helix domain-containing protein [Paenibacillus agilis]